jgi:ABC-type amino acid transport substrate-binding protein
MGKNIWESAFEEDSSQVQDPVGQEVEEEKVLDILSEDLSILINFGRLTSSFDFWGHKFAIKTLKMGEEMQASSIASSYSDSMDGGTRALVAALVAACIDTVDGNPIVAALGPNDNSVIRKKFDYMMDNYYWSVIEHVYEQYAELNERFNNALEEFKKK